MGCVSFLHAAFNTEICRRGWLPASPPWQNRRVTDPFQLYFVHENGVKPILYR